MTCVNKIGLQNLTMPMAGLGTWLNSDGEDVESAVEAALDSGIRHNEILSNERKRLGVDYTCVLYVQFGCAANRLLQ
jgi:hypothetical protein